MGKWKKRKSKIRDGVDGVTLAWRGDDGAEHEVTCSAQVIDGQLHVTVPAEKVPRAVMRELGWCLHGTFDEDEDATA